MDKGICHCAHCGNEIKPGARINKRKYCGKDKCRNARRATWQRQKMKKDAAYRFNQRACYKEWMEKHPGYWKKYRAKNPDYVERNRIRQSVRDARRRLPTEQACKNGLVKMLAKMDVMMSPHYSRRGGLFRLIPQGNCLLAKMDALTVKLIPV